MNQPLRIVSLIASATEIVCALGLRNQMVGRSHECDYPADVLKLPVTTSPKFDTSGTSLEIDLKVKGILQEALSVYQVDAALLDSLSPTHIITQSQCEVCAVSLRDVEEAACDLIKSQPKIISLEPNKLADVWRDITAVANALSMPSAGALLIDTLKNRMEAIAKKGKTVYRPLRCAYVEWIDPLMAGGNWMPELVEMAGAINVFGEIGRHSAPLSWDDFLRADPGVIIVAPCGFDIPRTLQDMHFLTNRSGFSQIKAVRENRVYVADGNQYFNRPGPRLVDSLEIIAEICYPDTFSFGHQRTGWVPFGLGDNGG